MNRKILKRIAALLLLAIINPAVQELKADLPAVGNNKVAYYVFDSHGPDHLPLTSFTNEANIVVVFEGTLWELADTIHYDTGWMKNVVYKFKNEIIRDIKILQTRGVKVLMNVDDNKTWDTPTPFTTYDSIKLDYKQFAVFIKTCAIDSLHLDGISLDIEHYATGTANYVALIKELGKYFGPKSENNNSQMYIAAIYSGYYGLPAPVIGKSGDVSSYLNFVMDMAYFNQYFVSRFYQWGDYVGYPKTMIGVLNDYFDLKYAANVAAWQPSSSYKAGIMVFAGNNLKSYTDSVFKSLVLPTTEVQDNKTHKKGVPQEFALLQNYPNPFNASTTIQYHIPQDGFVTLKVFDMLGNEVTTLVDKNMNPGYYSAIFDGSKYASGMYFARITVQSKEAKPYFKIIKMAMIK